MGLETSAQTNFAEQQLKNTRVLNAFNEKKERISDSLKLQTIDFKSFHILIIAFKEEGLLEVWAKRTNETMYKRSRSFLICASSGILGPKKAQGDGQVPEGFYHINVFNPASSYHLSLGIDYPNAADRTLSKAKDLGGQIFIHGKCVTIGCLPITDEGIKELYIYAVQARSSGQAQIPVYIFPFRMDEATTQQHIKVNSNKPELINFWLNLKQGYDLFSKGRHSLHVGVSSKGRYTF
jgi:murein L,D-transpeptidase YafK